MSLYLVTGEGVAGGEKCVIEDAFLNSLGICRIELVTVWSSPPDCVPWCGGSALPEGWSTGKTDSTNCTSLEMITDWLSGLYSLWAFLPSSYPMKI